MTMDQIIQETPHISGGCVSIYYTQDSLRQSIKRAVEIAVVKQQKMDIKAIKLRSEDAYKCMEDISDAPLFEFE